MNHKKFLLFIFLLIAAGCNGNNTINATNTFESTPFHVFSPTETATFFPSQTSTQVSSCNNNVSPDSVDLSSEKGLVVIYKDEGKTSISISGSDFIRSLPINTSLEIFDAAISPNHSYILFTYFSDSSDQEFFLLTDSQGIVIWSKFVTALKTNYGWFDDDKLWEYSTYSDGIIQLNLFNPFTGQRQKLRTSFPSLNNMPLYYWPIPYPVYEKSLANVIYPALGNELGTFPIILYNLEIDQKIISIPTYDNGKNPLWLPNGNKFIFNADITSMDLDHFEFYSVDIEGNLHQLTHLNDLYPRVEMSMEYSFSSNGNYMAFWFTPDNSSFKNYLAILDMRTEHLDTFCVLGSAWWKDNPQVDNLNSPVWSPDNSKLAVSIYDPQKSSKKTIAIIDITKKTISLISGMENATPIGWLAIP